MRSRKHTRASSRLGSSRTGFSLSSFRSRETRKPDRVKPVLFETQTQANSIWLVKMPVQEFVTNSSEETIATGRELAQQLRAPVLVLLRGDLGSGKTTLTKGIISGLGAAREEDVTSPTFNLVHEFHNHSKVYHVDLYRVETFPDLESLGLEDALSEKAIVIIEWPERFTLRTDWPTIEIRLNHAGGDSRRISISGLIVEIELK
jgi:tRNA threonylcarbamoyladenosine biosynthesis protein TsaE